MSTTRELMRPEILRLRAYRSAQFEEGYVRLNANESPWRPPGDATVRGVNWYPEPRPLALQARLAAHYGVDPGRLLVTRGSSEAIDLLIRGFCRAGTDAVVICPPTFGMYEVYAQVQAARIRAVPLRRERGYSLDVETILGDWGETDRLVFVCSPNNPTGNSFDMDDIVRLAIGLAGRGCVVLDAAYAEFSASDVSLDLLRRFENLVVLRTLSKAMGLAGVRCGVLLGDPAVVEVLARVLPPYTFPALCAESVERCLDPANTAEWQRRIEVLKAGRAMLAAALARSPHIRRVWPSDANFLMVEATDAPALVAAARSGGVLVRDFSHDPALPGCIRITVGTPEQNAQLLKALGAS
jgi:histidinol-phosphate aminotransferase